MIPAIVICAAFGLWAVAVRLLPRLHRLSRGHAARLADAVAEADGRQATSEHRACNRCRTGSTAFACTCGTDCYSPVCYGWYYDNWRDVLAGDGS